MSDAELERLAGAAAAYEALFVPALFQEWTARVADAAQLGPGHRVLDVACGTGILARAALARVRPGGSVTGLDINPGMLAVAAGLAPGIRWQQGTAERLPFPDSSFDAVVSQFGLMFFPDRVGALREMLRVLAPGGRLAVAVWDSLANTPAFAAEVKLLERMAGPEAANALRLPFALGDPGELASLFAAAGLPDAVISTQAGTGRFPSIRALVEADLRGWMPLVGVLLDDALIEAILTQAEIDLARFRTRDGSVAFESPAHLVAATKSAPSGK